MIHELNESIFPEIVFDFELDEKLWKNKDEKPCCIYFFNTWCKQCTNVHVAFGQLSEKYKDNVNFYRVNADANPKLSAALGIISTPAILFVSTKSEFHKLNGFFSESTVEFLIKDILL